MVILLLFIIFKTCKKSRCPLVGEWRDKLYIQTTEHLLQFQLLKTLSRQSRGGRRRDNIFLFPFYASNTTGIRREDFPGGPVVKTLPAHAGHRFDSSPRKILHAAGQLVSCATATEAHVPYSPCSKARETAAVRSPTQQLERSPTCCSQREACVATKTQHSEKQESICV